MSLTKGRTILRPEVGLSIGTPKELCYSAERVVEARTGGHWASRPWSMFNPDDTPWWLVPSPDWPSFRHGKFFFDQTSRQTSCIPAGIYVEKGLGPSVKAAYPSKRGAALIMEKDWAWYRFWTDLATGKFVKVVSSLPEEILASTWIQLGAGFVPDPGSFDPYGPGLPSDKASYRWDSSLRGFVRLDPPELHEVLPILRLNSELSDIIGALDTAPDRDWIWADVIVGADFGISIDEHSTKLMTTDDLWDTFLSHLSRWIV